MTTPDLSLIDGDARVNVEAWLKGTYDASAKHEILKLLKDNPKELEDAFYKNLSFGTGGMRGIMGIGSNRINFYTIKAATQGLVNYLKKTHPDQPLSVFISFDSRNNSRNFAETAAKVLAGNDIKVYITHDMRPTPIVSFGCRYKKCSAGIMITASHNPPEYNGYKVFWSDGGQILPPHDTGIMEEVQKITDQSQIKEAVDLKDSHIEFVEDEIDEAYLNAIKTLAYYPQDNAKDGKSLKIVYTSMHGTGITLVPRALRMWGFPTIQFVEQQIQPDGNFSTVKYPNPEDKAALELGIQTLQAKNGDILIATDPDADRVGVAVMHDGKPFVFTGNQIACLCVNHICNALTDQEKMPPKGAFIKTLVTSEMFRAITKHFETNCIDVLTGFKYIGQKITAWEQDQSYQFIFAGEESYGYLLGTYTRDKDAISASALIAEAALQSKLEGKTLVDVLHDLYETHGVYSDRLETINFADSKDGNTALKKAMERLRADPFNEIEGYRVIGIDDYLSLEHKDLVSGDLISIDQPKSDILVYWLEDGSKLMVRPSGTETKIKIYADIVQKEFDELDIGEEAASERAKELVEAMKELLTEKV